MLEPDLVEAIKKFVKTFRVARLRQIKRFFSDWEPSTYRHAIDHLLSQNILHVHVDDIVSHVYPGHLSSPLPAYNGTLRCLDMLTGTLKSSEVIWFDTADYPLDMRFLTISDEIYDVTYLDSSNWMQKYALLPVAWKKCIPPGQNDPYNHIAVVPSIEIAQQLRDLDFSQFIVIDGNGGVLGIYDNG